ncbi:MAG TPA: hypothetical protein VJR27_00620 [Candidatus Saccharimonadales bacterium]|nr:hypothetical protein [Candidatus Saccharimonadales bacterium]
MHLTNKDIFWRSWQWSLISGIIAATLFWLVSGIGNLFHGPNGGNIFLDLLISFSIAGGYFGGGLIAWRIADKYYTASASQIKKRYTWFSIFSFLVLVAVVYSPLSFLAMLWSFLAPLCVLWALSKFKQTSENKPRKRRRAPRNA